MTDDRPLTSEEMIRRAREDLAQAAKFPAPDTEEAAADLEPDDEPVSDDPEPRLMARAQRPRGTLKKSRPPLPVDPFSRPRRRRSQQTNPPAVAIIIAVAVAVLGIAVLLAAVAANAP
ncbi:MAG: hypothetical protein V3S62_03590 [Acidimicrobiia bacterium]